MDLVFLTRERGKDWKKKFGPPIKIDTQGFNFEEKFQHVNAPAPLFHPIKYGPVPASRQPCVRVAFAPQRCMVLYIASAFYGVEDYYWRPARAARRPSPFCGRAAAVWFFVIPLSRRGRALFTVAPQFPPGSSLTRTRWTQKTKGTDTKVDSAE